MDWGTVYCPYCGVLISEEYDIEGDVDGEMRCEILNDHYAQYSVCYSKDKERRRQRYGF